MNAKYCLIRSAAGMILLTGVLVYGGCGSAANDPASAAGAAPCATPEEVVARFNSMSEQELVNVSGLVTLFHPENEWQSRLLDSINAAMPIYELDAVMRAEYNTPYQSTPLDAFLAFPMKPARLVEADDSRGMAMFTDLQSRAQRLLLVKHNGSWWISAVTLEHDTAVKEAFDESRLLGMTGNRQSLCIAAPDLIRRIRDGEFYSAKNALEAIEKAVPRR